MVKDVPGLNLDGERGVYRLKEELKAVKKRTLVSVAVNGRAVREEGGEKSIPGRSRSYVLTGDEMGNFVCSRNAEQRESSGVVVGGIGQVGKEAEQVFRVQLTAIEGARDIDATLNIFGQERGVDSFCLQEQMISTCDSGFRSGQTSPG